MKLHEIGKHEAPLRTSSPPTKSLVGYHINNRTVTDPTTGERRRIWPDSIDVAGIGLTSLEGSPISVTGHFFIDGNKLTTLVGGPEHVGLDFNCSDNLLISLEGAPKKVDGMFRCRDNANLRSLEHISEFVGTSIDVTGSAIHSFEFLPLLHSNLYASDLRFLTTLHDVHRHARFDTAGMMFLKDNRIDSHVLGLLLVENLEWVHVTYLPSSKLGPCVDCIDPATGELLGAFDVVNKYLRSGSMYDGGSRGRMIHCQTELMDSGFEEAAKL